MASCFVGLYYNMIIAWTIYYLFASFTSKLPWDNCQNDFNTDCKHTCCNNRGFQLNQLLLTFTVCFNINEYADCTKLRENSTNLDVIYHKHTCIQTPEGLQEIRCVSQNTYMINPFTMVSFEEKSAIYSRDSTLSCFISRFCWLFDCLQLVGERELEVAWLLPSVEYFATHLVIK